MTALAESQRSRPLLELLAVELAPREGRWAAVARIATGSAITVVIAMVFQIPQPTYMAYIVFLLSKDEKNATVTSALGAFVAVTLAILLTLGLGSSTLPNPRYGCPLWQRLLLPPCLLRARLRWVPSPTWPALSSCCCRR